jgi:hypothetical protein
MAVDGTMPLAGVASRPNGRIVTGERIELDPLLESYLG